MRKAPVSHAAAASTSRRLARGFTLIEVMIVVAIVAILAAVAIPNYRDYILRGQLADAPTLLSSFRANMERYYQDNRQYTAVGTKFYPPCDANNIPAAQRTQGKFVVSCTALTATTYTLTAAGTGSVADFAYTLTETGVQATTKAASGWTTSATCWVLKKGQLC